MHCILQYLVMVVLFLTTSVLGVLAQEVGNSAEGKSQPDWVRTGQSRYDWSWLAGRFDANADGRIAAGEISFEPELFQRIDRNWDGALTASDFEWSKESVLGMQKETTFALFKIADVDSNGRLTNAEWQNLFEQYTGKSDYLNEEQLEMLMFRPRIEKSAREEGLRLGKSEHSPGRLAAMPVPLPGETAPDFELSSADSKQTIKLSQFRGIKPVVLVFGCYTCGNYRTYSQSLEDMYRIWGKKAQFLRVYVREAHPTDERQTATSTNKRAGILLEQPTSLDERCKAAEKFATALNVTTPMVVDGIDNRVGQAYGAWPDRLYIVDRDGKIAFTGGPGPFGFNPREMEQSLALLLLDQGASLSR